MSHSSGARTATLGILAFAGVAIVGGVAWWTNRPAEAEVPPPVVVEIQGTSFDVAPSKRAAAKEAPAPEVRKEETPAPSVPVVAPKAPEKPAEPAPPPVEAKLASIEAPAGKPAPAEAPAAPKPAPVEAPAAAKPAEKKADAEEAKPELITFSTLAFRYFPKTKDKEARDPFPAGIRAMNGKKVTIDGYMFPVDFEKGKVRSFLLSRAMFGCCYGDSPQMSEIVKVQRADGKPMAFEAVARVTGVLEVGEEFDSDGYVDSVFRIKAESVVGAPGWR